MKLRMQRLQKFGKENSASLRTGRYYAKCPQSESCKFTADMDLRVVLSTKERR